MKTIKLIVGVFLFTPLIGFGQNLVMNGDFEDGGAGYVGNATSFAANVDNWSYGCALSNTPDIYDANHLNCAYSVPSNRWSANRPVNISGNRYVGFGMGESITGKLTQELTADCTYNFQFAMAPKGSEISCPGQTFSNASSTMVYELILRKSTTLCTNPLTVWTSQSIPLNTNTSAPWQIVSGSFTLTPAQLSLGYDRIELKAIDLTSGSHAYVDDFSLTAECCSSDLGLTIDCLNSLITVTDLPLGSSVVETSWYKHKKYGGLTLITYGLGFIPSITPTLNGLYTVTITVILSNGTECTISETIIYSAEDCCTEINGGIGLTLGFDPLNTIIANETFTNGTYSMDGPIICHHHGLAYFVIDQCEKVEAYSIYNSKFDVASWTDVATTTIAVGSGLLPTNLTLYSNQQYFGEVNHLAIYIYDPNLTPTSQDFHLLYIPNEASECEGNLAKPGRSPQTTLIDEDILVSISPNPTNAETRIVLNERLSGNIEIVSISGEELYSQEFLEEDQLNLDFSLFSKGVYFVRITTNEHQITQKIVKD